jgi:hypothetical protein
MATEKYYETNKARWNELVDTHARSQEYDLEGFIAGKNSLHKPELDTLGDVRGSATSAWTPSAGRAWGPRS